MPKLRDVTVSVTDEKGSSLEEWGVQILRSQNKVSAYIRSTTDTPFRVSIQPLIPYITPDVPPAKQSSSKRTRSNSIGEVLHRRSEPHYTHKEKSVVLSSPPRPWDRQTSSPPPDFDFLACLYIDGRQKPERKLIVYLDPSHSEFAAPDGKVKFTSRCVEGRDGSLKTHAWVFKDVGVESSFEKMNISGAEQAAKDFDEPIEDRLARGLQSTALTGEGGTSTQDTAKFGQIVVTLHKVRLGNVIVDANYRFKHREGDKDDCEIDGIDRGVTHTTKLTHIKTLSRAPASLISYEFYDRKVDVFATFQFFYRSQQSLEKFNFPNFPRKLPRAYTTNSGRLNTELFNKTTPLSISRGLHSHTKRPKPRGKAFEENVRDQDFEAFKPRYESTDGYRDPAVMAKGERTLRVSSRARPLTLQPQKDGDDSQTMCERRPSRFAKWKELSSNEKEMREDRSTTPSSASSTDSICSIIEMSYTKQVTGSPYSPPELMREHMDATSILPDQPCSPINCGLKSNKGDLPTSLRLRNDHRLLMPTAPPPGKLQPPTIHPIASSSSEPHTTSTSLAVQSKQPGNATYRKTGQTSDADDEREDSDPDDDEQADDNKENEDPDDPNDFLSADKDDEGLRGRLQAVQIGARKRALDDDDDKDDEDREETVRGTTETGAGSTEDEQMNGSTDTVLRGSRGMRNELVEGDVKPLEEMSRPKRVKIMAEDVAVEVVVEPITDEPMAETAQGL